MKDFFELLERVFVGKSPKRKPMLKPLPIKVEVTVKKKDRIQQLEDEVKELREQSDNQTQLLLKLAEQLSSLQRDIVHANILPEK